MGNSDLKITLKEKVFEDTINVLSYAKYLGVINFNMSNRNIKTITNFMYDKYEKAGLENMYEDDMSGFVNRVIDNAEGMITINLLHDNMIEYDRFQKVFEVKKTEEHDVKIYNIKRKSKK